MNKLKLNLTIMLLLGVTQSALAQEAYIYPSRGQSAEQQEKDKFECYSWAKANTGYDPVNPTAGSPAPTAQPQATQQTGGVARGALGGAAIGAIAGDSSEAAGRGAAAGALFGGIKQSRTNRQAAQQQQQQQQQQTSQSSTRANDYNRAYAACLEGRGYTVK